MKAWTVYYRVNGIGKRRSHGCDSRQEAIEFIAFIKKAGNSFSGLKLNGKDASPKLTLQLGGESDRILKANKDTPN